MQQRPDAVHIAVILLPAFNAHATTAFIDPLRAANYLQARHVFRWQFYSLDGGLLSASNAMALNTLPLSALEQRPDMTVVSASWTPEAHRNERLLRTVRGHAREGVTLCGIDTGAFVLGYAGACKGRRISVHYEHIDAFAELFPQATAVEDLCTSWTTRSSPAAAARLPRTSRCN